MIRNISFRPGGSGYHAPASTSPPAAEAGRAVSPPPGAAPAEPVVRVPQARFAPEARLERAGQREMLLQGYQQAVLGQDEAGRAEGAAVVPAPAIPAERLDRADREVLDAFSRWADAHPDNTAVTKAYYRDVLAEMAEWLQRQPHPQIRSLSALQRLSGSDKPDDQKGARNLARQFTSSGAVPVRRGKKQHQIWSIVEALGQSAHPQPLRLPSSDVSRQLERQLHAFQTAAQAQGGNQGTTWGHVSLLKKLSHWLEAQAARGQAVPHGLDSLDKLARDPHPAEVQHVIDAFKKDPDNSARDKNNLKCAVDAWLLLQPQIEAGRAAAPGQQGERTDAQVLDAFERLADAHPGNTAVTKAYYRDVLAEMAEWLQQQPHPQIRSLSALQRLLDSDKPDDQEVARNLARQFTSSGAAPVRRGGNWDQIGSIVAALNLSAHHRPFCLPSSDVSRQLERQLHAFRTAAQARGGNQGTTGGYAGFLKKLSHWLEAQAAHGQAVPHGLDSLDKLARHPHPAEVQHVIDAFKKDPANSAREKKKLKSAVDAFWKWMQKELLFLSTIEDSLFNNEVENRELLLPDGAVPAEWAAILANPPPASPGLPETAGLPSIEDAPAPPPVPVSLPAVQPALPGGMRGPDGMPVEAPRGGGPEASARAGAASPEPHNVASAPPFIAGPAHTVQEMRLSGTQRPAEGPVQRRMVRPRLASPALPLPGVQPPLAVPRPPQTAQQRQLLEQMAGFRATPAPRGTAVAEGKIVCNFRPPSL